MLRGMYLAFGHSVESDVIVWRLAEYLGKYHNLLGSAVS